MATATEQSPVLTVGDVARHFGIPIWRVRRLYEKGILPPPPRAGLYRLVPAGDLPRIEEALRQAGYLPVACSAEPKVVAS
jgi:DNA-binding transcriptional MerR regulator